LALLASLAAAAAPGAFAMELGLTGFGTIGYARLTEHDITYLRYIDYEGTLKADSVVGVQGEARFNPEWRATVQVVGSAPRTEDDGTEVKVRWAFLSYRPNNDWLLRAGRVRPDFFFNTQNAEVGVTYDSARLPAELYALSPVYDFDGGAVTRSWALDNADVSLEAYWGRSDIKYRFHSESAPPHPYFKERVTVRGLTFTHATAALSLRAGAHFAKVRTQQTDFPETFAPMPIPAPAPFGGTVYVPTGLKPEFHVRIYTAGADWRLGEWRVTAEVARRDVPDLDVAFSGDSSYVTVARQLGKWTPYVTYARLLSDSKVRRMYKAIHGTPVPLAVQGPPFFLLPDYHAGHSDRISVYDQYSTMLGASYSVSATSKIKLEWMRTHFGLTSSLADGQISNRSINVLSASYSVAF
jgi:hypothetical protein